MRCYTGKTAVLGVGSIDQCRVFTVTDNLTGSNPFPIPTDNWPDVQEWVDAGGRLLLTAEHETNLSLGFVGYSPEDFQVVNDFLAAVGTSIQVVPGLLCTTPDPGCGGCGAAVGDYPVTDGFSALPYLASSSVSGGTALAWTGGSVPLLALEQVGDGFVMVGGDGNMFYQDSSCYGNVCQLLNNYFDLDELL
jgi:hypothetical protein